MTPTGCGYPFLHPVSPPTQAPSRQHMAYWLQELQQKRWEYCNNRTAAKRDSLASPAAAAELSTGLVAKENTGMDPYYITHVHMRSALY
ncbi:hypothetical protein FKM82_030271 [Ascaphus truei]